MIPGLVRAARPHPSEGDVHPNADMIGRDDVNDLEAILAITNTDRDEVIHAVTDNADAIFTWDYEKGARPALNKLYEKAKTSQWNGETDLPWDTDVDQEAVVVANALAQGGGTFATDLDVSGTPSRSGTSATGCASGSRARTGCSASSCTASRARSCARPRSSRRCRGSTPSTTRRPR